MLCAITCRQMTVCKNPLLSAKGLKMAKQVSLIQSAVALSILCTIFSLLSMLPVVSTEQYASQQSNADILLTDITPPVCIILQVIDACNTDAWCNCTEEESMLDFTRRTERKLRDRNSQLVVPNKSFARIRAICEQQLHLMRQPQQKPNQPAKPAATPARVTPHLA